MSVTYQGSIWGQSQFQPPKYNFWIFLDHIASTRPKLLDPRRHGDLIMEFAHWVGLHPERWSKNIGPIAWLFQISPDLERSCRQYRSDAY